MGSLEGGLALIDFKTIFRLEHFHQVYLTETEPTLSARPTSGHLVHHYTGDYTHSADSTHWEELFISPPVCASYFYMMYDDPTPGWENIFMVQEVEVYSKYVFKN